MLYSSSAAALGTEILLTRHALTWSITKAWQYLKSLHRCGSCTTRALLVPAKCLSRTHDRMLTIMRRSLSCAHLTPAFLAQCLDWWKAARGQVCLAKLYEMHAKLAHGCKACPLLKICFCYMPSCEKLLLLLLFTSALQKLSIAPLEPASHAGITPLLKCKL